MRHFRFQAVILTLILAVLIVPTGNAGEKVYMAYVSDSPSSSVPFWVAKEAGLFKKHGLDLQLIFINGNSMPGVK